MPRTAASSLVRPITGHIASKVGLYYELLRFPHTIFGMPFALSSMIIAARGVPPYEKVLWIIVAVVSARQGGMGFNRVIDAELDAANPRTCRRAVPMGLVSKAQLAVFSALALGLMVFAAYKLNPLCLKLSPIAVFTVIFYSFAKRFFPVPHIFLGACYLVAAGAAWVGVTGGVGLPAVMLGIAALFWGAGFDILDDLQDIEFHRAYGLKSLPQLVGVKGSLRAARFFHLLTLIFLTAVLIVTPMGPIFAAGIIIVAALLFYEHSILKENDLSKLNQAFFTVNGFIGISLFAFTLADVLL